MNSIKTRAAVAWAAGAPLKIATNNKSTKSAIPLRQGKANEMPNNDWSILKANGVKISRVSSRDNK